MKTGKPWVQISIDVLDTNRVQAIAKSSEDAGADWVTAGPLLITYYGLEVIRVVTGACRRIPVLADLKATDGVAKYFREAGKQGARIATVLGFVPDASVLEAIGGGKDGSVEVMADMYGIHRSDLPRRARELEALGVDYLLLHPGADEMAADPARDPLSGLRELIGAVSIPVGAIAFDVDQAVEAVAIGASFVVQGQPLAGTPDDLEHLRAFIGVVKAGKKADHQGINA
jgi:3-hexulose-6-phosphate synthase